MDKLTVKKLVIFEILKKGYVRDILIFISCWLFYGIVANIWVQFPDADWFNYQYYNAWAFLNDRLDTDFLAANYRSYFNPYVNIVQYFTLLKLNNFPRLFLFLSTLDGATLLFLVYKIGCLLFESAKKWNYVFIFFSIIYVILSPIMYEVMDFSRYDCLIAVFQLLAFYLLLKNIYEQDSKSRTCMILLSGVLTGIATALKLTSGVFCISIILIFLLLYKKITSPIKTLCLFALSTIVSFILTDGYWLYLMYKHFQNPFFPYFNDFFVSQYYDKISVYTKDYVQFHPKSFLHHVFYPFFKSSEFVCYGSDDRFWDARHAINLVCIVGFAIFSYFRKISINKYFLPICLFILILYYTNLFMFGNYRYIMYVSVLYGIVLSYSSFVFFKEIKREELSILMILVITVLVYVNQDLGYKHFLSEKRAKIQNILSIKDMGIKDNSYVFTTFATSAIIPNQNKSAIYMGYELSADVFNRRRRDLNEDSDLWFNAFYLRSKYLENEIREILNEPQSNVYIIFNDEKIFHDKKKFDVYKESLNTYSNKRSLKNCRYASIKIFNNINKDNMIYICEYN